MEAVISQAHSLNLSVVLKPHVDLKTGLWRANIGTWFSEAQWAAWWASYTAYLDWTLALAQRTDVAGINIGTELCATEHREVEWRALVARLRRSWSGPLWYGTNWNWPGSCPAQPGGCPGGPLAIKWWDAVSAIGVDAYYPLAAMPGQSVDELARAWGPILAPLLELATRLQRPLIFPEIGYASFANASVQPWACCAGPTSRPSARPLPPSSPGPRGRRWPASSGGPGRLPVRPEPTYIFIYICLFIKIHNIICRVIFLLSFSYVPQRVPRFELSSFFF